MARPQKKRFICRMPQHSCFQPQGVSDSGDVILAVDEYEAVRLIDLEGSTQEECAVQMQVGRTTIQSIYNEARRKIADAIVNGKRLVISGGDYRLCAGYGPGCGRGCGRHRGCAQGRCDQENPGQHSSSLRSARDLSDNCTEQIENRPEKNQEE